MGAFGEGLKASWALLSALGRFLGLLGAFLVALGLSGAPLGRFNGGFFFDLWTVSSDLFRILGGFA